MPDRSFSLSRRLSGFLLSSRPGRRRALFGRIAGIVLLVAAIVCGFATYAALTEALPFGRGSDTLFWLLNIDLIVLLLLASLIAHRLAGLWSGRRKGIAGSQIQARLVLIFSLLTAVPAIIMTIFAAYFFHVGIQTWFSERVQTAISESRLVAEAYLNEHQQAIRTDIMAMASDLDRQAELYVDNREGFDRLFRTQTVLRNLPEAVLFSLNGQVFAHNGTADLFDTRNLPPDLFENTRAGIVTLLTVDSENDQEDRVRALVRMKAFPDSFLFVGRPVDPNVIARVRATREASSNYEQLEIRYADLQVKFILIFIVVALLLLLSAIWFGLLLARQLVAPISSLISASEKIAAGDFTARVPETDALDEFSMLARSFNRMTGQIQIQRDELVSANRQMDYRRRFTETILEGVTAGILNVDEKGYIRLSNTAAARLFGEEPENLAGRSLFEILPDIAILLEKAFRGLSRTVQGEIPFSTSARGRRTLLVRIVIESTGDEDRQAIITFDDITELQSAQRKAAWSDVARRIAHEIKNPLTPIQLSAERLRRRYSGQIQEGQDVFEGCINTIIRHVEDIGRMVGEFSDFARMPEPVFERTDILQDIRNQIVFYQSAQMGIEFSVIPDASLFEPVYLMADSRQIRQSVSNLIQNAVDSLLHSGTKKPEIHLYAWKGQGYFNLVIADNGPGFPSHIDPDQLAEPYVTFKEKGTGLGLAIVKKILEDHNGALKIGRSAWQESKDKWRDLGGAVIGLCLPVDREDSSGMVSVTDKLKA